MEVSDKHEAVFQVRSNAAVDGSVNTGRVNAVLALLNVFIGFEVECST